MPVIPYRQLFRPTVVAEAEEEVVAEAEEVVAEAVVVEEVEVVEVEEEVVQPEEESSLCQDRAVTVEMAK